MNQTEQDLKELKQLGARRRIAKRECLYRRGCQDNYVYFLEKGVCALTSTSPNGRDRIHQYFLADDFLCFTAAFNRQYPDEVFHAFSVTAKSDCVIRQIPYGAFRAFVDSHPSLYSWLFEMAVRHYDSSLKHSYFLQDGDNMTSLCQALLELSVQEDPFCVLHKEFSYGELASYLGIHTITVTRLMGRLKEEHIIVKHGHQTVIIDMPRLKEMAGRP